MPADGFRGRAENENDFMHLGIADVGYRLRQDGAVAQRKQLLRVSHAGGAARSQNDGAYPRKTFWLHRDNPISLFVRRQQKNCSLVCKQCKP